jgi:ABC-type phosphate/phosphonate transport system ATPase subunit
LEKETSKENENHDSNPRFISSQLKLVEDDSLLKSVAQDLSQSDDKEKAEALLEKLEELEQAEELENLEELEKSEGEATDE